jgi:hypothetical protein
MTRLLKNEKVTYSIPVGRLGGWTMYCKGGKGEHGMDGMDARP